MTTGSAGGGTTTGSAGGPASDAEVHLVGRFDQRDAAGPRFTWSGSTLRMRLDGSALDIQLDGDSGIFFQVVVDGSPAGVFQTSGGQGTYHVVSDLPAGLHDIEVYRRNEGFMGVAQFRGFVPGPGSAIVPSPWPYQHRLEFIGDSITCGYGVEGADAFCSFSGETESAYASYAAIAARNLGAAAHLIVFSGKGVFQNFGGDKSEPMPALYPRTLTRDAASEWDFTRWIADAIVINLGTNDFSAPLERDDFVNAYVGLIHDVRSRYPDATIFCVGWQFWGADKETYVQQAIKSSGDPKLRFVEFTIDPADGWGCDYHPSAKTHAKLGQLLTVAIKDALGW
jgi:lysophospholipase L1-like esterase